MSTSWRTSIAAEWAARQAKDHEKPAVLFPLAMNPFGEEEILAMTEVLLTGRLTLGEQVEKAEKRFAQIVGVPYAVMVNSGSSANLLAVSAASNKLRAVHCNPGDQVLVPAVCWSTSVFPLLQNGLIPIFVDVSPRTFNVSLDELEKKLTPRVKAVMAVHVLGNAIDMRQLMDFVTRHKLIMIEDTCESLGSFCKNNTADASQMLGTFGDFGTYSFYFSHHITSGEGGMIVCKTEEDFNLLRCLRAHGWTRHLTNRQAVEESYPDFDSRFLFVNIGYNLRPLEVQGAMISVQLEKLSEFNACRRDNMERIRQAFSANDRICRLLSLMEPSSGVDPAWFGVAALLHRPYAHQRLEFLKYLEKNGVENRPIISGNFIRQPCIAAFCENELPENYPGAEAIHMRGFFVGVHQIPLAQVVIDKLVEIILAFPFDPKHVILVTGSHHPGRRCIQDIVQEEAFKEDTVLATTQSTPIIMRTKDAEWIFLTTNDGDLRRIEDVTHIFKQYQPTRLVNFAAQMTSSIEETLDKPVDVWLDSVTVNNNLLKTAFEYQAWCGPIKVVSIVSSVFIAPLYPHDNSYAYAQAQQALLQLTRWYRQQYRCSFISILSEDMFGPYGDGRANTAEPVHTLIQKIVSQKQTQPRVAIVLPGPGSQEYRSLFVRDFAKIIMWALVNYDEDDPLLATGNPVTKNQLAQLVCECIGFAGGITFDSDAGGNHPLYPSADLLGAKRIDPPVLLTSISTAIEQTIQWYANKTI